MDDPYELHHDNILEGALIIGVSHLELIYSGIQCKKKHSEKDVKEDRDVHRFMQRVWNQHKSYKLKNPCVISFWKLVTNTCPFYGDAMKALVGKKANRITCEDLLYPPPFDVQYNNDYHIVTSMSRPRPDPRRSSFGKLIT